MAYTNGIFRIDLVSGSDTARTALTSCTASNPSGSITRINKTAHGLVTGAVVDLTLFTAWLNDAWKITVVDANNFDLDGAVWQSTADTSGTATPRGGSSWADAWLTVNNGATAARIQPGDEIRFAKTADPVSLGQNATWTDGSQTVTLTSAVTKKIEDAISGWTAAANVTASTQTNRKLGASAVTLAPATSFTTGKVGYKAIAGGGTQDFSAYTYINLWLRGTTSSGVAANTYKICLCSDATGDTIVNEINLPAIPASNAWAPLALNYGAALGASIQSVAIYANTDPGASPVVISMNNIFAGNGDLTLVNLFGKSGDVNYNVQSIDGVTVKIDSNDQTASGLGYSGTTSTEAIFYRIPILSATTGTWQTMNEGGTSTIYTMYTGGYNTTTDLVDGQTVIASGIVGAGTAFSSLSYITMTNWVFARFSFTTSGGIAYYENMVYAGNASSYNNNGSKITWKNCKFLNSSSSNNMLGTDIKFVSCLFANNTGYGSRIGGGNMFISCTFRNNPVFVGGLDNQVGTGPGLIRNCLFLDSTEVSVSGFYDITIWSYNHDQVAGNHYGFTSGGLINWQTTTKQGADPGAWKIAVSNSQRGVLVPVKMKIADVACAASALVTVKAWVKKDHATNIAAKIYVEDELYTIGGVVADDATKASDTNWEELTITFTPTEAGVVPIYIDAWYVAGTSNVYVGSVTITQA